jgi:hypothetical protein
MSGSCCERPRSSAAAHRPQLSTSAVETTTRCHPVATSSDSWVYSWPDLYESVQTNRRTRRKAVSPHGTFSYPRAPPETPRSSQLLKSRCCEDRVNPSRGRGRRRSSGFLSRCSRLTRTRPSPGDAACGGRAASGPPPGCFRLCAQERSEPDGSTCRPAALRAPALRLGRYHPINRLIDCW